MRKALQRCLVFIALISIGVFAHQSNDAAAQKKQPKAGKKKIVLIPGTDSHGVGEHEHLGGCILLAKLLNEKVNGVEAVVTEQGWPKDSTVLDDADAIVMYSDGGDAHIVIPHIAHINRLMKKGVGLVNLHYAVEIPKENGGDYFLAWLGGYFETDWSVNPFWTADFKTFPKHPITNGVKPFTVNDEWYYHMRFAEGMKNVTPILTVLPPASTMDRGDGPHEGNAFVRKAIANKEPQVLAWAFNRPGGGRGFGFTGLHVHKTWLDDNCRKLLVNAITWTAKIEIPANGFDTPTPTQGELAALCKKP